MAGKYMTAMRIGERLRQLHQLSRERALPSSEADEIERLRVALRRKLHRLPDEISDCEAKLARLRAEQALLSSL